MKSALFKLFYLLDARTKRIICLLCVLILIGTGFELLGIGAVLPIVTLFSTPDPLQASPFLKWLHDWINPESKNQLIAWVLVGVIFLYVFKNIYLFFLMYFQARFTYGRHYQLASRLFRGYLYNPYPFHLKHNSAELLRNINLVRSAIRQVLLGFIVCFTETTVTVAIFIFLIWIDPFSAVVIAGGLGILVGTYYLIIRDKLTALGELVKFHEGKTIQQVHQGLGSIKEIKILGHEDFFNKAFANHLWGFIHSECRQQVISQSPRFYIETITVIFVLGTMSFLLFSGQSLSSILITFSLFAVAVIRIIPGVNRLTWAMTVLRFGIPSLEEVYSHIKISEKYVADMANKKPAEKMTFEHQIELRNVTYQHENSTTPSLKSVSLSIPKRSWVGLVGSSGAGKTTLSDVVTGLLNPSQGEVLVDGKNIQSGLFSWQTQIGHVPQFIYLTDDTVRSNVAFGVDRDSASDQKIWEALALAQLDEFVRDLPNGLDTRVGESGIHLSGGQRQRIGIARAVYHEPQVLVLDEATAALDNETERAFTEAIENLSGKKTILLIAHRLTTIEMCDVIFFFDRGQLLDSGTYESLLEKNPKFRKMVRH